MKKFMRKGFAIVMALTMVFAMSVSAFADTNSGDMTVTVKLDSRSYDLESSMANLPEYEVTVPANSTVQDVVEKAAEQYNLNMQWKSVPDYYNPNLIHKALTDVNGIGENSVENGADKEAIKSALLTFPDASDRGYYYMSGWVYGLTAADGIEYFPSDYMDATNVVDGMTVTLHYSVTGCWDINTSNWTSDFSNPDVTMWGLYDQVTEKIAADPTSDNAVAAQAMLDYVYGEIDASASAAANTSGLTAWYFSHEGLTDADTSQFIPALQSVLAEF